MKINEYFYTVALDELVEDQNTSNIEIMRTGKWKHPVYGDFVIDGNTLSEISKNFEGNVRGVDIAIDLEHGETSHKTEAMGWVKRLNNTGKKLLAEVEWTESGKKKVQSKAYRYFSPEFKFNYEDAESGKKYTNVLLGGSLTNRPFIKGMEAVVLSEEVATRMTGDNVFTEIKKEEYQMNSKLLNSLKLSENATQEEIDAAISKMLENSVKLTEDLTKAQKDVTKLSEDLKTEKAAKEGIEKINEGLSKRLTNVEVKLTENEWDAYASKKLSEGKLTKAMAEKFKDAYMKDKEGTVALMETLPVMVDLTEKGSTQGTGEAGKGNIKLFEDAVAKVQKEQKLGYFEACQSIERNNPELYKLAEAERRGF